MTDHRHSMKKALSDVQSLDQRIEELKRLNELREDPTHPAWDDLDAGAWKMAREGRLGSFDAELQSLINERHGKLQEAALYQNAYHEGARATQAPHGYTVPNGPIGQIVANDGQLIQFTQADLKAFVQMERDEQNYAQQVAEAHKRHPDWAQVALRGSIFVPSRHTSSSLCPMAQRWRITWQRITPMRAW